MRIVMFISCFLCFGFLQAQPVNDPLKITPITGDFYVYTTYHLYKGTPVSANGMYVVTSQGVIMIDTPWDSTQYQPLLDSIERRHHKKVVLCVATHSHEDRTGGLDFLKARGVKTYTSKKTDLICITQHQKRGEFHFDKDTVFTVGEHSFQTYFAGEGHTKDNIVIWFPKEKILHGGCLVKSTEATDLGYTGEASISQWPATIVALKKKCKRPNYVIPGHQGWSSTGSLDHTLKLLREHQTK